MFCREFFLCFSVWTLLALVKWFLVLREMLRLKRALWMIAESVSGWSMALYSLCPCRTRGGEFSAGHFPVGVFCWSFSKLFFSSLLWWSDFLVFANVTTLHCKRVVLAFEFFAIYCKLVNVCDFLVFANVTTLHCKRVVLPFEFFAIYCKLVNVRHQWREEGGGGSEGRGIHGAADVKWTSQILPLICSSVQG